MPHTAIAKIYKNSRPVTKQNYKTPVIGAP
jgi:hypothetical protein